MRSLKVSLRWNFVFKKHLLLAVWSCCWKFERDGKNDFVVTVVTRLAKIKEGLDDQAEAETETRLAKIKMRRALFLPPIPPQLTSSLSETSILYKEKMTSGLCKVEGYLWFSTKSGFTFSVSNANGQEFQDIGR